MAKSIQAILLQALFVVVLEIVACNWEVAHDQVGNRFCQADIFILSECVSGSGPRPNADMKITRKTLVYNIHMKLQEHNELMYSVALRHRSIYCSPMWTALLCSWCITKLSILITPPSSLPSKLEGRNWFEKFCIGLIYRTKYRARGQISNGKIYSLLVKC